MFMTGGARGVCWAHRAVFKRGHRGGAGEMCSRIQRSVFSAIPDGWNLSSENGPSRSSFASWFADPSQISLVNFIHLGKKAQTHLFPWSVGATVGTFKEAVYVFSGIEQPHLPWQDLVWDHSNSCSTQRKGERNKQKKGFKFESIWISIWRFNISGESLCCASLE